MDMEVAGDFIAMAAQLIYIKSKMLLPVYEEEEEDDPRLQLVEMLLEYQRIKEMTPYFRQQTELGRDIYVKQPELLDRNVPVEYHHSVEDLLRAARAILEKAQQRVPPSANAFKGIVGKGSLCPVDGKNYDDFTAVPARGAAAVFCSFLRARKTVRRLLRPF